MMNYWTKEHPAFGLRTYWRCPACGVTGSDEPAMGVTAQQTAEDHLASARAHFSILRLEAQEGDRRDELVNVMREELAIFQGRISVSDCALLGARIGNEHYRFRLRERDEQIGRLLAERNVLTRKLAELSQ